MILYAGPGDLDRKTADAIKARVKYPLNDFTGQTKLQQLLMLLKHAHLVIAQTLDLLT